MKTNYKYAVLAAAVAAVLVLGVIGAYFVIHSFKKTSEENQVIPTPPAESPLRGKMLSPEEEVIKRKLVAPLGKAGTLADMPNFKIDYIAPDIFQVEIKTVYVTEARSEAVQWFKDKGFTEEGICKLPVTFYLNPSIRRQLQGSGVTYNVLPDFCR